MQHGYTDAAWQVLVLAAEGVLVETAARRDMIYYSDLAARVEAATGIPFAAYGTAMDNLLGEIYTRVHHRKRVAITSITVLKGEDRPGVGFWNMSEELCLFDSETDDPDAFWIGQVNATYEAFAGGTREDSP